MKLSLPLFVALSASSGDAFTCTLAPRATTMTTTTTSSKRTTPASFLHMAEETSSETPASSASTTDEEEVSLEAVESLGRGAAKAKRGRRKGSSSESQAASSVTPKTNLAPEETFYEGPPALSETILPTISILTVIGLIPAAAAWARQAWVRYKITNRRVRVTSGFGGKEMAEIVYPDIVEIRTARRLFGDGDMVAFLRDGARFEIRNIPNFEEALEFILNQVDQDVASEYRKQGEVTRQ